MTDCGIQPWAIDHCAVQYSVASPPLYQIHPLCGVPKASAASSGAGRALLNQSTVRRAALRARMLPGGVPIPGNRPLEPFAQRRLRAEAEELLRTRSVELATRLTVRHRRVPDQLAVEARELGDQLRELADRRLDTGAEVHRLRAVVALGRQQHPLRGVIDVQELACRRAVAPE